MAGRAEAPEEPASALEAGVIAKGEYRCVSCGYGVTVYRELPRCPMCSAESWEQLSWSSFVRRAKRSA
jgi:rubrerythrin